MYLLTISSFRLFFFHFPFPCSYFWSDQYTRQLLFSCLVKSCLSTRRGILDTSLQQASGNTFYQLNVYAVDGNKNLFVCSALQLVVVCGQTQRTTKICFCSKYLDMYPLQDTTNQCKVSYQFPLLNLYYVSTPRVVSVHIMQQAKMMIAIEFKGHLCRSDRVMLDFEVCSQDQSQV